MPIKWETSRDQTFHWAVCSFSKYWPELDSYCYSQVEDKTACQHHISLHKGPDPVSASSMIRGLSDREGQLHSPGGQLFGDNAQLRWEVLIPGGKTWTGGKVLATVRGPLGGWV